MGGLIQPPPMSSPPKNILCQVGLIFYLASSRVSFSCILLSVLLRVKRASKITNCCDIIYECNLEIDFYLGKAVAF